MRDPGKNSLPRRLHFRRVRVSTATSVFLLFVPLMVGFFIWPVRTLAQGETTSAIFGEVTDATNAAIPGATVRATNRGTGSERSAKTDEEGRFNFLQLRPGAYSVKAEADGFDPQQNDNIVSGLGQKQDSEFQT